MQIRPAQRMDLDLLMEIDGTIESMQYLHVDRAGEGMDLAWTLRQRPLRERLVRSNPIADDTLFLLKQVVSGADDGMALIGEHDDLPVALLLAMPDPVAGVLRIRELRVDFDHRREGLATALLYQVIAAAREQEHRAVAAETTTDNFPGASLLLKCGFEIAGLDCQRQTNHDLVKEAVTLFWYAAMD